MVYQIIYTEKDKPNSRGVCMFDIEYFQKKCDGGVNKGKWYSEIHCLPCIDGLTYFLKDNINDIDIDEFVNDATEIQEIRGLLYERHDNRPREHEYADEFHYHTFRNEIEEMFDKFNKKYGTWLNVD